MAERLAYQVLSRCPRLGATGVVKTLSVRSAWVGQNGDGSALFN